MSNVKDIMNGLPGNAIEIVKRTMAEKSLEEFVKQSWHVLEKGKPLKWNWHLSAICKHLECVTATYIINSGLNGKMVDSDYSVTEDPKKAVWTYNVNEEYLDKYINHLLINIPPRAGKSTILNVFWPAYCWGPARLPFTRFMRMSYQQHLTTRDSLKSKRIIESKWYQDRWGHVFTMSDSQNAKIRYDNNTGGYSFATSTGSLATGDGGDFVLIDDPTNAKDAGSMTELNKVITLWKDTLSTRIDNPEAGCYIVVMQRLHPLDLAGYLLEQKENGALPNLNHLCLPARYEKNHPHPSDTVLGFEDPRKIEGEPLDKNRFGDKVLKGIENTLNSWAAAGQLQQRPRQKEGNLIMTERIKLIDEVNMSKVKRLMRYWDKAATEGVGSSKTVGVLMGEMETGYGFSVIVLDVVFGNWSAGKRDQKMRLAAEKDDMHGIEYEIAVEREPGSGGKEAAIQSITETFIGFKCSEDRVTGAKDVRLGPFSKQVEVYNVACLKRDWTREYIQGLENCFEGGAVTDFGDATSGAFNWLFKYANGKKRRNRFHFSRKH